jgi:hypothetical protein
MTMVTSGGDQGFASEHTFEEFTLISSIQPRFLEECR